MNVKILHSARRTLADGIAFYERQNPGLGAYFLSTILADLRSLRIYGGIPKKHFEYHRMTCSRFPYSIYYLIKAEEVRIYAVLDDRRDLQWRDKILGTPSKSE